MSDICHTGEEQGRRSLSPRYKMWRVMPSGAAGKPSFLSVSNRANQDVKLVDARSTEECCIFPFISNVQLQMCEEDLHQVCSSTQV